MFCIPQSTSNLGTPTPLKILTIPSSNTASPSNSLFTRNIPAKPSEFIERLSDGTGEPSPSVGVAVPDDGASGDLSGGVKCSDAEDDEDVE